MHCVDIPLFRNCGSECYKRMGLEERRVLQFGLSTLVFCIELLLSMVYNLYSCPCTTETKKHRRFIIQRGHEHTR